jgi:methylenetetrahydrofolate reductase (NADPH)
MDPLDPLEAKVSPERGELLARPRFEVIPARGIEDRVVALTRGATVTVTASPRHGIERTLEVSERLVALGYDVVPHLAARMIAGRPQLEEIAGRLAAAGIGEAFVIGGDASPVAGMFRDGDELLDELASLPNGPRRLGVGGYPEGHPVIPPERLLESLRHKQTHADYVVTQICFDAAALAAWVRSIRAAGITLPVVVGLPGAVDRRRLAEISMEAGVGRSLRYLTRHRREVVGLVRSRRYDPTPLLSRIASFADDSALRLRGLHLFTFNQVEATRDWLAAVAGGTAMDGRRGARGAAR